MKGEMREGAGRRQAEKPERWPEAGTGEKGQGLWRKVITVCGFDLSLSGLLSDIVGKFSYTNRSSGGVICFVKVKEEPAFSPETAWVTDGMHEDMGAHGREEACKWSPGLPEGWGLN